MASIGKASLTIVPKFDNLGKSVTAALDRVDPSRSGEKMGKGLAAGVERGAGGLVKTGAIMGVFSAATAKAMDVVSSSVGGAVSRLDTLNNYPRVMQALGYSAEESQASIAKMSERLTGLPTALNDMTSTVQGISAITGDLGKATDSALALNDMLLASGSSTQLASAAMEQFRQMLAKGKPEMEDWKSLTSAMPGQMAQLAKSMLGPTATANDLYAALGGGKNEAILSMDDLMAAMIRLDAEGGEGITSFAEQARNATGGIESSMANMQTAVSRGMASVLDAVGTDTISSFAKDVGGAFENALKAAGDGIARFKPLAVSLYGDLSKAGDSVASFAGKVGNGLVAAEPQIAGFADHLVGIAPTALTAAASFAAFKGAGTHLAGFYSKAKDAVKATTGLEAANGLLGTSFSPLTLGITAAAGALGLVVTGYLDAKKKSDNFKAATTGLSDAVAKAVSLDEYAGKIDGVGEKAKSTAMSVDEMTESVAGHVAKIEESNEKAEAQIGQLNAAQSVIDQYIGSTDLSADAQGRLEWALKLVNEQFGLTLTAADVAAGAYTDAEENVIDLKNSIFDLVEAKKQEIQMLALSDQLTEVYAARSEAAATLASEERKYAETKDGWVKGEMEREHVSREVAEAAFEEARGFDWARENVSRAAEAYGTASNDASRLEEKLGDSAKAASDSANEFDKWGNGLSDHFKAVLDEGGTSLAGLKEDLHKLGVDTEALAGLSESELIDLARAYDGTAGSIEGALRDVGVATGKAVEDMTAALNGMEGAGDALSGVGVDVSDFARLLAEAGVSTEQLNAVGSEQLAQLAQNCGGNMDMMVWFVQHYNDTPLLDKDGNVQVDQAELMDAQGNVYTWNGSYLVDQNGRALMDDAELVTAQGEVVTWNASSLKFQSGRASITGNVREQLGLRDDWNNGSFFDKVANASINIFRNVTDFFSGGSQHAAGGIRLNAAGGYRFHGAGAIATKAMPLDIVGEDGAEAIVPLTNKRYSLPFAKTLAEQMGNVGGRDSSQDVAAAVALIAEFVGLVKDGKIKVVTDTGALVGALADPMDRRLAQMQIARER